MNEPDASGSEFRTISQKWESSATAAQGTRLISLRTALINEAANKLRGEELAEFLKVVVKECDFNTYFIPIIGASQLLFTNVDATDQRKFAGEWVAGVSNTVARQALAHELGRYYRGSDIGSLMRCMNDLKTKQNVLDGYCLSVADKSPVEAFRAYETNLPEGGDYSGLAVIAANMRSEFREFLTMLPSDELAVVSKTREHALKSWAKENPAEAADFVHQNPDTIRSDYLAHVVATWMESDSDTAIAWAAKQDDPIYREKALRGIVDFLERSEPEKAWNLVLNDEIIGTSKEELLKKIHASWIKTDSTAAELARTRYQATLNSH